jgi:imidazoleglycerol-phosphate dehydratase
LSGYHERSPTYFYERNGILSPSPREGGRDSRPRGRQHHQQHRSRLGHDLHVELRYGRNPHHVVEAVFKGVARALRVGVERDARVRGLPTVKGAL